MSAEQHTTGTSDELRSWRRAAFDDLAAAIEASPGAAIPAYPEWTVRDLAVHLVRVLSNATMSLRSGTLERPDPLVTLDPGDPPETLAATVRSALDEAESALRECGATAIWTPVGPRPPRFWSRRLLREAVLHRWDAQAATGTPRVPDDEVATVLIDEALDTDVSRALASTDDLEGMGPLTIRAGAAQWMVDPVARVVHAGAEANGALVAGQPASVWLWLMRREPLPGEVAVDDADDAVAAFTRMIDGFNRPAR